MCVSKIHSIQLKNEFQLDFFKNPDYKLELLTKVLERMIRIISINSKQTVFAKFPLWAILGYLLNKFAISWQTREEGLLKEGFASSLVKLGFNFLHNCWWNSCKHLFRSQINKSRLTNEHSGKYMPTVNILLKIQVHPFANFYPWDHFFRYQLPLL